MWVPAAQLVDQPHCLFLWPLLGAIFPIALWFSQDVAFSECRGLFLLQPYIDRTPALPKAVLGCTGEHGEQSWLCPPRQGWLPQRSRAGKSQVEDWRVILTLGRDVQCMLRRWTQ